MLVARHHALHRQRVVIDVAVQARAGVGHHIAADRANAADRHTFEDGGHIVGRRRRVVHEDLDIGAGKQLATRALILPGAGRAAATDICILIVQGVEQGHAGVVRCRIGVAVRERLHGAVHQRRRGTGVESQRQRAGAIDVAANVAGTHEHIAAAQRERTGGAKHVIGRGAALAREAQRRTAPVVALKAQFAVRQRHIGVDHDRCAARRVRHGRCGVDREGVHIAEGRCVVDRGDRQLHRVARAGIGAAATGNRGVDAAVATGTTGPVPGPESQARADRRTGTGHAVTGVQVERGLEVEPRRRVQQQGLRVRHGRHAQPVGTAIERIQPGALAGIGARQRHAACKRACIHIAGTTRADDVRHQSAHCADWRRSVFGLGQVAVGVGEDGGVVGAGEGDTDGAINRAAIAIVECDGEGFDLGLVFGQVFNRRGRNAVVPGDHATQTAARGVGGKHRCQCAQRCRRGRRHADAVRVGHVHVGKGDRAAVGQCGQRHRRAGGLGHRASDIIYRHHRGVVGARDGHRHILSGGVVGNNTGIILHCDAVGGDDGLAHF